MPSEILRLRLEDVVWERFKEYMVCAWLGNSAQVARKHYLQITDEHFRERQAVLQNRVHLRCQKRCSGLRRERAEIKSWRTIPKKTRQMRLKRRHLPLRPVQKGGRTWIRTMDLVVISDAL